MNFSEADSRCSGILAALAIANALRPDGLSRIDISGTTNGTLPSTTAPAISPTVTAERGAIAARYGST